MQSRNTLFRLFHVCKDGGPESHVTGYFLIAIKPLFSIVLLRFSDGSRDAYHSHAFNSISWIFNGKLKEQVLNGGTNEYSPSILPILTFRSTWHKVVSEGVTWAVTFRGPMEEPLA